MDMATTMSTAKAWGRALVTAAAVHRRRRRVRPWRPEFDFGSPGGDFGGLGAFPLAIGLIAQIEGQGALGRGGLRDPRRRDNLPAETSELVDRRDDVAGLVAALGSSRLVTVLGTGGIGKTRVALRVAHETRRSFPGGSWWVSLVDQPEPVGPAEAVAEAVARAMALPALDPMSALAPIVEHIGARPTLIVLDNCEHVIGVVAAFVERLLVAAPAAVVLATSREALRIEGERTWPLPGLAGAGVELFLERVTALGLIRDPDADELGVVAAICERLGGVPLAIELAAARMTTYSARDILARLDDPARFLTNSVRSAPARHRTIEASIAWSYGLCTEAEQLLWQRATVFRGGFDFDAAASVCQGDGLDEGLALDSLQGLVAKSVVAVDRRARVARYSMLDTIRLYGASRLAESGSEPGVVARHRDWVAEHLGRGERAEASAAQAYWRTWLEEEHANIAAAVARSLAGTDDAEQTLALCAPMALQQWDRGYGREIVDWLTRAIAAADRPSPWRSIALSKLAMLFVQLRDDPAELDDLVRRAAEDAAAVADDEARGWAAAASVATLLLRRRFDEALIQVEPALARLDGRPVDQLHGVLLQLRFSAIALTSDPDEVNRAYDELVARLAPTGESGFQIWALHTMTQAAIQTGDLPRAAELARGILAAQAAGNASAVSVALATDALALTAARSGDVEYASRMLALSEPLWGDTRPSASLNSPYALHRECARICRGQLGDARFDELLRSTASLRAERVRQLALQDSSRSAEPAVRPAEPPLTNPLTSREREVADLVALGLSNREIAMRLVVSSRTAEGHVERILVKLGLNSRTQIAAWVMARRERN